MSTNTPKLSPASVGAAGALLATFLGPILSTYPALGFILAQIALIVFAACLGLAINGRLSGVLIDNRNRVSLSKFQAYGWSILVLAAFIEAVATIAASPKWPDPSNVTIPANLLIVMGISAASFVASPVLLSLKSQEAAPAGQAADTAALLGDQDVAAPVGKVYARDTAASAQWLDMFRGEEVSNAATPDLSKIQQFLITVVALGAYGLTVWRLFATGLPVRQLPDFSAPMAWLIGISHGGYLAYKAAPHGRTASAAQAVTAVGSGGGAVG